jgi:hypothetical protein
MLSGRKETAAFSLVLLAGIAAACSSKPHSSGFNTDGDGDDGGDMIIGGNGGNDGGMFSTGNTEGGAGDAMLTGDGPIDVTAACDMGLAVDDSNASSFAKAIGICTTASGVGYGLVSASYANAFGATAPPASAQWGLLPGFGSAITPREGSTLAVLSSGYARNYDDPSNSASDPNADFVTSGGGPRDGENYPTGNAPPGFPKAAQGCAQSSLVNDMIDVKLVLKAPMNANGFKFDFDFYSSEWPNYVCSNYNDAFVAYLTSSMTTGNISFDSNNNPVAVNIDFFNRCTPNTEVGCAASENPFNIGTPTGTDACAAGPGELAGTGFGDTGPTACNDMGTATYGGATGWLTTQAPIQPGEQFTLDFMIWDAGDGLLDSSVLIDHFEWIGGNVTTGTSRPPQ